MQEFTIPSSSGQVGDTVSAVDPILVGDTVSAVSPILGMAFQCLIVICVVATVGAMPSVPLTAAF